MIDVFDLIQDRLGLWSVQGKLPGFPLGNASDY
jgi:hypothetical protein